uniref:Uncharacterized protein n=1 Tax=viral metagenome TaxID=1070528 RepID=A0A6M3XGZ6_9ZZZZ
MSREKKKDLENLRQEAKKYNIIWRSCWNCNPTHEHLKKSNDCVIFCLECGRYYFKGTDITEE